MHWSKQVDEREVNRQTTWLQKSQIDWAVHEIDINKLFLLKCKGMRVATKKRKIVWRESTTNQTGIRAQCKLKRHLNNIPVIVSQQQHLHSVTQKQRGREIMCLPATGELTLRICQRGFWTRNLSAHLWPRRQASNGSWDQLRFQHFSP